MSNSGELFNPFYEAELAAARSFDVENMNYEQLSALCEKMGTVKCGVSKDTFDRIPTRTLYASDLTDSDKNSKIKKSSSSSSISHAPKNQIVAGVISSPQKESTSAGNTIGISRAEALAKRLELVKKDSSLSDGSEAIRRQRLLQHYQQSSSSTATTVPTSAPTSSLSLRKQQSKQLSHEACCICMTNLLDLEEGGKKESKVKTLPCKHSFHAACIKAWLMNNKTCPVCKADVQRQASSVGALLFQLLPPK